MAGKIPPPIKPENRYKGRPAIATDEVREAAGIVPVVIANAEIFSPPTAAKVVQKRSVTSSVGDDDSSLKEYIRSQGQALIDRLFAVALNDASKHSDSLKAIEMLLNRGYGRPAQTITTEETVADLTSLHLEELRKAAKR